MLQKNSRIILALVVIASAFVSNTLINAANTYGKPFFASRSQGNNLARRLVGEVHELLACHSSCRNAVISITPEWSQNFNTTSLGHYFSLRSSDLPHSNVMSVRGTAAQNPAFNPSNADIVAQNLLLASNFSGSASFIPHIENAIVDVNFRLNLYNRLPGLYFEVGMPIAWTRSHVEIKEAIPADAGNDIAILASNNPINAPFTTQAPFFSVTQALEGQREEQEFIFESPGADPVTLTIENLRFARVDGKKTKSGIADLELVAGYNILCCDTYHLALNARITIPTGTRPEGVYIFEPIIGGGHHLQVGGGLSAHFTPWSNGCDRSLSIWFDSALYNAFGTKQRRTFDLKNNGVGSRYLLFKRFNESGNFAHTFVPGPNITTLGAQVSIGLIGQAVLMADYKRGGMTIDVGYSAWGRDAEKIKLTDEVEQGTFGIWGGTPIDNIIDGAANRTNSAVTINGTNFITSTFNEFDTPSPFTISSNNIDVASAQAPAALSHSLFAHISYAWHRRHVTPFIGVGGQAEFSGKQNNALNQWGIWTKIGMAFF